jgi:MFS family permease
LAARFVQRLRTLSPAILLYLLAVALVGFAIDGGVYAVLLNLFLVRLDYGPERIGLVNAAGMLTFAIASLPAGALGTRWGSRRIMMIGLALMAGASAALPLADALPSSWWLGWLVANIVVLYLGLALFFVNTAPFVMEAVHPSRRSEVFSLQSALLSLAAFAGSLLGGVLPPVFAAMSQTPLTDPAPYRYALMVAAIGLGPAILLVRSASAGADPQPSEVEVAVRPADVLSPSYIGPRALLGVIVAIAVVRLLQVSGVGATNTFFNVYLDSELHVPTAQIGAIIAVARLLAVPAALATSPLTTRFGHRAVVIGASLSTTVALLPIVLVPHWSAASLSFVGVVALSWIRYAASMVFFLELVPPSRRALVSGVTEMAGGLTFTVLTFGGGYLIALVGYRSLFLTGAGLTLLSALVFWLAFRNARPAPEG